MRRSAAFAASFVFAADTKVIVFPIFRSCTRQGQKHFFRCDIFDDGIFVFMAVDGRPGSGIPDPGAHHRRSAPDSQPYRLRIRMQNRRATPDSRTYVPQGGRSAIENGNYDHLKTDLSVFNAKSER